MRSRTPILAVPALGLGILLALAGPSAADAHVEVSPVRAAPGSYPILDIRVANESPTADVIKVEVELPTDTPLLLVRFVPVPGWTTELTETTLPSPVTVGNDSVTRAVTKVTWTADGSGTPPDALQLLPLSVGPVPDTGALRFPTREFYSDGSIVDWNDPKESDDNPAPTLYVNDAPPTGETPQASTRAQPSAPPSSSAPDVVARVLGVGGLALGATGAVVSALALRRRGGTR